MRRRVRQLALISTEAERGGLRQRVRKGKQSAASLHFFLLQLLLLRLLLLLLLLYFLPARLLSALT